MTSATSRSGVQRLARVVDEAALDLVPGVAEPVALLRPQVADVELLAALLALAQRGLGRPAVAGRGGDAALVLGPETLLQLGRPPAAGQHDAQDDGDEQDEDDHDD